jgi:signal transduction histidine kinase
VPGDDTPGTGLGLSIVKAIVHRHGGSLTLADANPGCQRPGLRVRITLPAIPLAAGNRAPQDRMSVAA